MILTAPAIIRMKRLPVVSVKMICHLMESWVRDGNYGNAIWGMLTSFAPHSRCETGPGQARFRSWEARFRPWHACFRSWHACFSHGMPASAMAGLLQIMACPLQIMACLLQIMAGLLQPVEARFRSWQACFSQAGLLQIMSVVRTK